jgi:TolA-binding protein
MAGFAALQTGDYKAALAHASAFEKSHAGHGLAPEVAYVAAESQLLLSQYPQAEQLYRKLLAAHAGHADAETWKLRLGLALYLQKKYAETIQALAPQIATLKKPELVAEAHYLAGSSQNELKQYEAAVQSLEASLRASGTWRQADEALLILGYAYRQLNNLPAATSATQKVVANFPQSRLLDRAHYRLGEYAYASGDYKTAASEYQRVILKWPNSELAPHAVHGLGWAQLSQGDHASAAKTFTSLVDNFQQHPLAAKARYARAMARQPLKEYAAAIDDLQAFLQTQPGQPEKSDARYVLGLCQANLNQHAQAAATFEGLLDDDPQYAGADKAHYELAWACKSQGKEAEAAETFSKLAEKFAASPLAAESLYHVGEFQYAQEDFKKAAASYHASMQKAGKSDLGEKAAHKLGWAYYRQDDFENAQKSFAYQRTTFPQGVLAADAAFMESESLFKLGKYAEALTRYQQVKNPSSEAFTVLALLHGGQAAGKLKQWDTSLALLDQCAKQFPESEYLPEVLYEQGWARQNQGRAEDALALYEQVTAKTNREVAARARFMIGEIYFEKKDHSQAVRNFYKVVYGYGYPQWQADALYEAARCLEVLNKTDQAKKDYQDLMTKYPQSDKAALAQKRLAELGS